MRVLHRDDLVLAVDKPAGIATVPGRNSEGSLLAGVRALEPKAMAVHRLDKDTSGVVLFALTPEAHRALNAAFEGRKAEKRYLALVRGDVREALRLDAPLSEGRRGTMRVADDGDKALTLVEPAERFGEYTLCTCFPKTGRTHQIRVHLAQAGHPLALDPRYGAEEPLRVGMFWRGAPDPESVVLARTPLHAAAIRVPHPSGKRWLSVEAPLADDIARALDLLRAARRYG